MKNKLADIIFHRVLKMVYLWPKSNWFEEKILFIFLMCYSTNSVQLSLHPLLV